MESAQDFVNRYFDGTLKLNGELETMLELRDSMIRAECADRAEKFLEKYNAIIIADVGGKSLRAAIMGE